MGHSRGTVTALAAAGGSTTWGFPDPDPRVKAIMGLAIGARAITNGVDLADVTVPTVLVAGGLDRNSSQEVSEDAFDAISSADKLFVGIPNAVHRSFDSTYCAQLQSAGAAADADRDGVVERRSCPRTRRDPRPAHRQADRGITAGSECPARRCTTAPASSSPGRGYPEAGGIDRELRVSAPPSGRPACASAPASPARAWTRRGQGGDQGDRGGVASTRRSSGAATTGSASRATSRPSG